MCVPRDNDYGDSVLIDMNGDGVPDRVHIDKDGNWLVSFAYIDPDTYNVGYAPPPPCLYSHGGGGPAR